VFLELHVHLHVLAVPGIQVSAASLVQLYACLILTLFFKKSIKIKQFIIKMSCWELNMKHLG